MKKDLENKLKDLFQKISTTKSEVSKQQVKYLSKKETLRTIEELSSVWFDEVEPKLRGFGIDPEIIKKYSDAFKYLLTLTGGSNRKSSFEKGLDIISKGYRDELLIPVQITAVHVSILPELDQILSEIANPFENEYLMEAVACASKGYLRAAVVLGWCATIDRIHNKVEEIGFKKFNDTSISMEKQTKGRYKNFNQKQDINSISELRTVFDNVILWIIEGMGLIDINEHTRLKSCFDMRCHSGHPGNAPITKYNVLSFFSDINEIVLKNTRFQLLNSSTEAS